MASDEFRRIILKVSGECFLSDDAISRLVDQIQSTRSFPTETVVVVGGGHVLRGRDAERFKLDRVRADQIGMLGTVLSGVFLTSALERAGLPVRHLTAPPLAGLIEAYSIPAAQRALGERLIVVLSGGLGIPFFSTDTTAALRACELGASALLKGTKVDGVYSADPLRAPDATRYPKLSYDEALTRNLSVMDATAFSLCRQERIPIVVFDIFQAHSLTRILSHESIGTVIC